MNRKRLAIILLVATISFTLVFMLLERGIKRVKSNKFLIKCDINLRELGKALQLYANDYDGQYPHVDKWCDLLVENAGIKKKHFICKLTDGEMYLTSNPIDEVNFPADVIFHREYNDVYGQHLYSYSVEWSHYAINPNAKPGSPGDMVLLFETRRGWNQFGGPEILSDENHVDKDRKGCNVLFNDGNVKFIKPKDLKKLKFKD